jgi:hypothetical protein
MWGKRNPDLTNNPLYLEPRVTAAEMSLAQKAEKTEVALKADKTYVDLVKSGTPKIIKNTLAELNAAYPTGSTDLALVLGNVKEVASLTVAAVPTVAGNVTVTLNGVATTIAVDPATDTTTALVATKIRNKVYPNGTVTGGSGSTVTFTAAAGGTKIDATYSAGTTGATGTMTTTTQGVDPDGKWYYWNSSAWTAGAVYQSTGIGDGTLSYPKFDSLIKESFKTILKEQTIVDYQTYGVKGQAVTNTTRVLRDFPLTKGILTEITIDAYSSNIALVILKKTADLTYQVISVTDIVASVGLNTYPVNIFVPEDGLYLGVYGDYYYYNYNSITPEPSIYHNFDNILKKPTANESCTVAVYPNTKYQLSIKVKEGTDNTNIPSEITRLDAKIDNLPIQPKINSKWLVIGDSISVNTAYTDTFYHAILATKYGFTVTNMAVSATGYLSSGWGGVSGTGISFKGRIAAGEFDGLDFDFATIFFGTNDWHVQDSIGTEGSAPLGTINDSIDTLSIYGGIKYCISKMIEKYPTKGFGVIAPIQRIQPADTVNAKGFTLDQVNKAIQDVCNLYHVPYIDVLNQTRLRPYIQANLDTFYYTDGVHLSHKGHEELSKQLDNWVLTL